MRKMAIHGLGCGLLWAMAGASLVIGQETPPTSAEPSSDFPSFFIRRQRLPAPAPALAAPNLASLKEALKSPDSQVRDEAAAKLRPIFVTPPREEWNGLLQRVRAGLSREQLKKFLAEVNAVDEGATEEFEDFRLDDVWVLRCVVKPDPQEVQSVELVERMLAQWVEPAKDFTGEWKTYYINGDVCHHIQYKEGKYDGTHTVYYPKGQRQIVQHYKMHVAHGSDVGYFRSGNLQYTAFYHEGKQAGIWRFYNEDGSVRTSQQHPLYSQNDAAPQNDQPKRTGVLAGRLVLSSVLAVEKREEPARAPTILQDAIIWMQEKQAPRSEDWPREVFEEAPSVTLRNGKFAPRVLAYDARRTVRFTNLDEGPTNIIWNPLAGTSFNRLLPAGQTLEYKLAPQRMPYPIQSNLHPHQEVWIFPCGHQYFTATNDEGKFRLENLPTGKWEFRLWHPDLGYLKSEAATGRKFYADISEGTVDLGDIVVTSVAQWQKLAGQKPDGPKTDVPNAPPVVDYNALRAERIKDNDRGSGSEFVGAWTMRLPRGFEYAITLEQREDGLLVMKSQKNLTLLGTFACQKNRLMLVETRESNVHDFTWDYRDGILVLVEEDLHNGANYVGATLKRAMTP